MNMTGAWYPSALIDIWYKEDYYKKTEEYDEDDETDNKKKKCPAQNERIGNKGLAYKSTRRVELRWSK